MTVAGQNLKVEFDDMETYGRIFDAAFSDHFTILNNHETSLRATLASL